MGHGIRGDGARRGIAGTLARICAAGLVLALAACGRAEGVLVPVDVAADPGQKVDLLAATTRAPSETPGVVFSGERGDTLAFTNIVVNIPQSRDVGSIQWPRQMPPDPERDFTVTRVDPLTRAGVSRWFSQLPGNRRRVLVFVHGFNTPFDAAVFRLAQFVHDTRADLVPVLFSWPSRGRALDYIYDRESTNFSRSDLARVLAEASASPKVDEVVVLAHSMGSWLAMEALRDLALKQGRVPPKIKNVVLASPDLDIDVFERQMRELGPGPKRPRFTIFVSTNDTALGFSRFLAGSVQRVGSVDLSQPEYAARLERAQGITVLDLTALQGGDSLNHTKFATQPDIVQLIGDRMVSGQSVANDPRIGDSKAVEAVEAVGGAVGAVVSAPIRIFTAGVTR